MSSGQGLVWQGPLCQPPKTEVRSALYNRHSTPAPPTAPHPTILVTSHPAHRPRHTHNLVETKPLNHSCQDAPYLLAAAPSISPSNPSKGFYCFSDNRTILLTADPSPPNASAPLSANKYFPIIEPLLIPNNITLCHLQDHLKKKNKVFKGRPAGPNRLFF